MKITSSTKAIDCIPAVEAAGPPEAAAAFRAYAEDHPHKVVRSLPPPHHAAIASLDGYNADEEEAAGPGRFAFLPLVPSALRAPVWIIKRILETGALVLLFGDAAAGKTFLAILLSFCILTSRPFAGYPIKRRGPILYICGEGRSAIERRLRAAELAFDQEIGEGFFISNMPTALADPDRATELEAAVELFAEMHEPPLLLIIDTWSRNLAGDENASDDVAVAVALLDRLKARWPEMTVIVIHHVSKGDPSRARGSTVLRAAVDVEMRLERGEDSLVRLDFTKMKDGAIPSPMAFAFRSVPLGVFDEDEEELTSAVLDLTEYTEPPKAGTAGRGKNQGIALRALTRLYFEEQHPNEGQEPPGITWQAWKDACVQDGLDGKRFAQTVKPMIYAGQIILEGSLYFPA